MLRDLKTLPKLQFILRNTCWNFTTFRTYLRLHIQDIFTCQLTVTFILDFKTFAVFWIYAYNNQTPGKHPKEYIIESRSSQYNVALPTFFTRTPSSPSPPKNKSEYHKTFLLDSEPWLFHLGKFFSIETSKGLSIGWRSQHVSSTSTKCRKACFNYTSYTYNRCTLITLRWPVINFKFVPEL